MAAAVRQRLATSSAAASTAVADLITGRERRAEVIAEFSVARYLRVESAVIALVTPDAVRLPNALVVPVVTGTSRTYGGRSAGDQGEVRVGGGCVRLGRHRVTVGRWWDPVPRLARVTDVSALARAVETMRSLLPTWPEADEPAADRLVAGREALASTLSGGGTSADAAEQLVGLGPGLTPAGDDILAGAVAGMVIFGRALDGGPILEMAGQVAAAVADRRDRTTVLAADLARHSATGAVAEPVAAVCAALAGKRPLEPALERLLAVGHTSGRDLAEGLLLGVTVALTIR